MSEPTSSRTPDASAVAQRTLHVVPHTHWDREWYRAFESYRFRLIETLDRVLDSELPFFLLDGQTAVIDDYLALRPERRDQLVRRIAEGRLGVGPWYVLADEFLVSGESLVRNLLVGREGMRALGASTGAVGYLPDMFGHIGQMPQILRGFGLESAVVWRGAAPGAAGFTWRAPDGSEVAAAWLPSGYYQTMLMEELPLETRRAQLETYLAAYGAAPEALLLSGADHMAPRTDTAELLAALNGSPDAPFTARITPLSEAVARVAGGSVVLEGELRETARMTYLLPGVLSARTYLKQANVRCQTLLERYVEPLESLAALAGRPETRPFVGHAWRELLKNHPHDSICGCSIDQVHREMLPRFASVEQVGAEVLRVALGETAKPVASPPLFVFNPTGWRAEGWVEGTLDWPLADAPEAVRLLDAEGAEVPSVLLSAVDTERFCAEIDFNPDWFPIRRFRLAARVALDGLAGLQLRAVAGVPAPVAAGVSAQAQGGAARLENDRVAVVVEDGRLDLLDKLRGERYADVLFFLDEGDAGDTYNFSPLDGDAPVRSVLLGCELEALEPHRATLVVRHGLTVPVSLAADRASRAEATTTLTLESRLTLEAGDGLVAVETRFDNAAQDHRLRVVTTLGAGPRPALFAEAPFGVFEREPLAMSPLPSAKAHEAVMPEFPQLGFSVLAGSARALAVANHGLHEASLIETESGWALATTLVRSVGWLSRDDLRTRGGGAGPRFQTPEAQCGGERVFAYALLPFRGAWAAQLPRLHRFASPLTAWEAEGLLAPGVEPGHPHAVVSALKRAEAGGATVLRLYNPTGEAIRGQLEWRAPHGGLRESDMAESLGAPTDGRYELGAYASRTWLLLDP